MNKTVHGGEHVVLSALNVAESEYVCTSLDAFRGMIDVPRLGDHDGDSISIVTIGDSRRLQQDVYRRLAQLNELCYLTLGQIFSSMYQGSVENAIQMDCLEMSLKSGMGELASLNELR